MKKPLLILFFLAVVVLTTAYFVVYGGKTVLAPESASLTPQPTPSPTIKLTGKVFYLSSSIPQTRDTIILDFDRGIKVKTGIPYIYRGDTNQFLLISPTKTKIAVLGEGTSTFEVAPFEISNLFIKNALACMPAPVATLYVIDLEKNAKVKLIDKVLFNDYATSSPVQWLDNNSICYQEYRPEDSSRCPKIIPGKVWQVSLDSSKEEIPLEQCRSNSQPESVIGWNSVKVNENETLVRTSEGAALGDRWESSAIILKNIKTGQQKILVAKGSQLITSEVITLAPLKNAFLFETVKQGKTKMENAGNEEIEIMSLNGDVILRTAGTYATWIP